MELRYGKSFNYDQRCFVVLEKNKGSNSENINDKCALNYETFLFHESLSSAQFSLEFSQGWIQFE